MSRETERRTPSEPAAREDRLAEALRRNLKRRKAAARKTAAPELPADSDG